MQGWLFSHFSKYPDISWNASLWRSQKEALFWKCRDSNLPYLLWTLGSLQFHYKCYDIWSSPEMCIHYFFIVRSQMVSNDMHSIHIQPLQRPIKHFSASINWKALSGTSEILQLRGFLDNTNSISLVPSAT